MEDMLVHTLICEAHIWFALPCLRSFIRNSRDEHKLLIHDDGTLSPQSMEMISAALPKCIILTRGDADACLADQLRRYPKVLEARTYLPHVLKLIDLGWIGEQESILCYIDTDVLFFRPFQRLFTSDVNSKVSGAFLLDRASSFGARVSDFSPLGPLKLVRRLNSGLFWIRREHIDYDRIEYLFRRWGLARILEYGGWFEQTVWADIAWRAKCCMFDASQINTASQHAAPATIGTHYVTPERGRLRAVLGDSAGDGDKLSHGMVAPTESIRLVPSTQFGLRAALAKAAACRVRRYAGKN
jgi:hypothetical protein